MDGSVFIDTSQTASAAQGKSIFTGEISNLKAHPQRRTDLDFGLESGGKYWVTLFVDGVFSMRTYHGYTGDNVRALMDQNGLTSWK